MKKKGFTLIEMLAVITMIALITLVVLPLISNQYADKKDEISEVTQKIILDAAELYANETGKFYQTITLNDLVKDGKLEEPVIDQKTGKEIPLTKEVSISVSGDACIVGIDNCDKITYKEYANGEAVYFNPETGEKCDSASAVSTVGTKTGCMKWYAFNDSADSKKVKLLLDHNTTANIEWCSSEDYYKAVGTEQTAVTNDQGPITVLAQLATDVKTWDKEIRDTATILSINDVANITGNPELSSYSEGIYIHTFTPSMLSTCNGIETSGCQYGWIYDRLLGCGQFGCPNEETEDVRGYWLNTVDSDNEYGAFQVSYLGYLDPRTTYTSSGGIRPVITVEKYKLS